MVTQRYFVIHAFFFFFLNFQLQKAKEDAEKAYNEISEAAKNEVNGKKENYLCLQLYCC